MPLQVTGTIVGNELNLASIAVTTTPVEVAADEVAIYALAGVDLYRQNEIVNGWKWLFNGIRDRNLLDDQFNGVKCYSYSDINYLTEPDRRTSSALIDLGTDDIGVGIGEDVTALFHSSSTPLLSAFTDLIDAALERYFKTA